MNIRVYITLVYSFDLSYPLVFSAPAFDTCVKGLLVQKKKNLFKEFITLGSRHSLPLKCRTELKILLLTYKSLNDQAISKAEHYIILTKCLTPSARPLVVPKSTMRASYRGPLLQNQLPQGSRERCPVYF